MENDTKSFITPAPALPEENIQQEEVRRIVLGANKEDCYLDRFNDSLEAFHRMLLEMQTNAMNGCLWW